MTWEQPPESTLDTYYLGERSLNGWHEWLTTDKRTGQPAGDLETPASRYGSTAGEVAWWAVAAQAAYSYIADSGNSEESFEYFMRLAVNDNVSVYGIVRDFREVIPVELDDLLDWDRAEG